MSLKKVKHASWAHVKPLFPSSFLDNFDDNLEIEEHLETPRQPVQARFMKKEEEEREFDRQLFSIRHSSYLLDLEL